MRFSCIISLVLASTAASAVSVERQRHAQRAPVVEDPAYSRSADGAGNDAGLIEMYIGLDAQDRVQLERVLHQVSDPNHDDYGKHLSRDEAKDLLRPPAGAFDSVKRWLLDEGVAERHIEDRGQWVRARVPADIASKSKRGLGLGDVSSVPQHARRYISMIRPIHAVSSSRKRNAKPEPRAAGGSVSSHGTSRDVHGTGVNLTECITTVTPACIHELYHISDLPAIPHPKSLFGVPGFNNQTVQYDDLEQFIDMYAPFAKGATISEAYVNGGSNPQGNYSASEGNMDIQYAVGTAYDVPIEFISVGGGLWDYTPDLDLPGPEWGPVEPFLEFATYLLELPDDKLPQVISISYSTNEQIPHPSWIQRTCDVFGQLGTRGVSVLTASGDRGVGAACQINDGTNRTRFIPGFPSVCPYVTSVGGTEGNSPEQAAYFSGSGFSELWPRPAWQDKAVQTWMDAHGSEFAQYYNHTGRAYPDVSAMALGHQIVNHGVIESTGGTSASTPVFAGIIALLNNERFKHNLPPLGFLNPWLYSTATAGLTDIVEGRTKEGCDGESRSGQKTPVVPGAGWTAVKGWDPASGLGTPRFDKLKEIAVCQALKG